MSTPRARDFRLGNRFEVPGRPQVFDELAGRVLGRALDLSGGGLKLLVAEPLENETLYQVHFDLSLDGRGVRIVAGLQVLDQREDEDGFLCTGTRFIHLDGACARHIVRWLAAQASER